MCSEGLARLSRRVWRRFVRGSREISLVPSLHSASTDDDTKIEKLHMSGFSRGKPEVGRNELGLCTARYESKGCC